MLFFCFFFSFWTLNILMFPLLLHPRNIELFPRSKTEAVALNLRIVQGNDSAV